MASYAKDSEVRGGPLRAVLRSRNLRNAQLSSAAAWTSEFVFMTALGVYAFERGGTAAVGLVGFLRIAPAALALPFVGALGDRMRRERLLALAGLLRALSAGGAAAIVAADLPAGFVYALAVVSTIGFTAYRPAHLALMPSLCSDPGELTAANAVRGILDAVSALIGPLLAAALLAGASVEAAFAAVAVLALLSALWISLVSYEAPPLPAREQQPIVVELREGFAELARNRRPALMIGLFSAQTFVRGILNVLAVVIALDLLDMGDPGVGYLWAAFGAGGLIGGVASFGLAGSSRLASYFAIALVLWGAPLILAGAIATEPVALLALAIVGAGNAVLDVAGFTLLQRLVDDRIVARVLGLSEMMFTVLAALGSLLAPALVSLFGIRGALVATGVLLPVLTLVSLRALRRIDAETAIRDDRIRLLRGVPMLRLLPAPTIEHLAGVAQPLTVAAGVAVFSQGDRGDRFYVIRAGTAEVLDNGQQVRRLAAGDSFGEIALLRSVPRTAGVRALEELELSALDGEAFRRSIVGWTSASGHAEHVVDAHLAADQARRGRRA